MNFRYTELPPCKSEDVIKFSFENLSKFLTYLLESNQTIQDKLYDVETKINSMHDTKLILDDFQHTHEAQCRKLNENEESIQAYGKKFLEMEERIQKVEEGATRQTEVNERMITEMTSKLLTYDDNLNNLNRIVEENVKTIFKLNEMTEKCKEISEGNENKIDKVASSLKETQEEMRTTNEKITQEMKQFDCKVTENLDKINEKVHETECNLVNAISDSKMGNYQETSNIKGEFISQEDNPPHDDLNQEQIVIHDETGNKIQSESQEDSKFKSLSTSIEKIVNEIRILNKKIKEHSDTIEQSNKDKEKMMKEINELNNKNIVYNYMSSNQPRNLIADDPLLEINTTMPATSLDNVNENMRKLSENVRLISLNLTNKSGKDEVDKIYKILSNEIETLQSEFKESSARLESRMGKSHHDHLAKHITPSGTSLPIVDTSTSSLSTHLREMATKITQDMIQTELASYDFKDNPHFKEALTRSDEIKFDVDRLFESIVDIRSTMITNEIPENIRTIMNKELENENRIRRLQFQVDEMTKNLEEENEMSSTIEHQKEIEFKTESTVGSLREYIRNVSMNVKSLNEKLEKVSKAQENMNAEILAIVKKDLQMQSIRILEEFKQDLKFSIAKIEEQLRDKVDRFNLDEFGRKLDNKFLNEIKLKLDRTDMKRNNSMINKKIDLLENKISKTLVDTLIDLQMEEAPLIVKKSFNNGEKCASCNQVIPHHHVHSSMDFNELSQINNKNKSTSRPNIKIKDESTEIKATSLHSIQLPDIVKSTHESSMVEKKKTSKVPSRVYDEKNVQNINQVIHEELEKKFITGENLIKSVNKVFDSSLK